MAIEETDLPGGTVGQQVGDTATSEDEARFSADDFRLRLDAPLFHRDGGMGAPGQLPRLRELTWEHVVRPTSQQPIVKGPATPPAAAASAAEVDVEAPVESESAPAQDAPKLSLDSLRLPAREVAVAEPEIAESQAAQPEVAESELEESPVAEPEVAKPEVAELPRLSSLMPLATVLISGEVPASVDVPSAEKAERIDGLLAALDQMDAAPSSPAAVHVVDDDDLETLVALAEKDAEPNRQVRPVVQLDLEPVEPKYVEPTYAEPASVEPAYVEPAYVEPAYVEPEVVVVPEPELSATFPEVSVAAPPFEPDIDSSRHRAVAAAPSAVEAELNRLAFLPDREDDEGPVEVPQIAHDDGPVMPTPSLSQDQLYSPRQSGQVSNHRVNFADLVAQAAPMAPRKKRHPVRKAIIMVVLLAMIAGGLYAAKYYLLDTQWHGDVKRLAADVEEARGISFDHAVEVKTLPVDEYAVEIARRAHGVSDENMDVVAGEWRALGLLTGALDERSIGLNALADSPAYYDPASETIYVAADIPPALYRFAMHRALTLALLDQEFGWGDRIADASPAEARGTRALYDADALSIADSMTDDAQRAEVLAQIFGLYATFDIPVSPSPFGSTAIGRLGLTVQPYFESMPVDERAASEQDALISDGQTFDLRWLVNGGVEAPAPSARGALFWYHALAGRIDNDLAWSAALAWRSDIMSTVDSVDGRCVVANLYVDPASFGTASSAFQQWAAAAPAESRTEITTNVTDTRSEITINACDPGSSVPTNDGRAHLSLGGAPLDAEQFQLVRAAQPTLPAAQIACAVAGGDSLSMADERGVIDPADGWPAPAAHTTPDPNHPGCVSG